jgi:hypothetical protein
VGVLPKENIEWQVDEGHAEAVVCAALGDDDVAYVARNVRFGKAALGDAVGENRVGG